MFYMDHVDDILSEIIHKLLFINFTGLEYGHCLKSRYLFVDIQKIYL